MSILQKALIPRHSNFLKDVVLEHAAFGWVVLIPPSTPRQRFVGWMKFYECQDACLWQRFVRSTEWEAFGRKHCIYFWMSGLNGVLWQRLCLEWSSVIRVEVHMTCLLVQMIETATVFFPPSQYNRWRVKAVNYSLIESHVNLNIYGCSQEEAGALCTFLVSSFPSLRSWPSPFGSPSFVTVSIETRNTGIWFLPLSFCSYIINVTFSISFFLLFQINFANCVRELIIGSITHFHKTLGCNLSFNPSFYFLALKQDILFFTLFKIMLYYVFKG